MKPIPHIPKFIEEDKPKFSSICNQCELLVESKKIKQNFTLVDKEEVSPTAQISKKIDHQWKSPKKLCMTSFQKNYHP